MASSEQVRRHPELLTIMSALLNGKSAGDVAREYGLSELVVRAFGAEAGIIPRAGPPPRQQDAPCSEPVEEAEATEPQDIVDRPAVHERQALEEASRRRGEPEGQRPEPDSHPYNDESRAGLRQMLDQAAAERKAYEDQPMPAIGARLANDPLGPPGFEFHCGMQPASRLGALVMRDQARREARRAEWFRDLFRWHQEPPADWFD